MSEKHYSIKQIAEEWNFSVGVIRNIFRKEPGVLRVGHGETKNKNKYVSVRVRTEEIQRILAHYAQLLSLDHFEIFPKQVNLDPVKEELGNPWRQIQTSSRDSTFTAACSMN